MSSKRKCEIICRCNNISRESIEKAIREGAQTLNEIFDATSAGVGPCGGTCRRKIGPLLEYYLIHREFPEKITTINPSSSCEEASTDKNSTSKSDKKSG